MSRKNAQKWFLTWPQLGEQRPVDAELSLTYFCTFMKERLPDNSVIKAILSHEDHADRGDVDGGTGVHIHLVFQLENKWNCPSNMEFFDDLYGKHPNIQTCRNFQKSVVYVGKDGDYATLNIDYEAMKEAVENKISYSFVAAAKHVKEGKTVDEIDEIAPHFVMRERRKIEEYIVYQEQKRQRKEVKPVFPGFQDVPRGIEDRREWQSVVDWANKNFLEPRGRRQQQLWLYGAHGIGKSYPWDTILIEYFKMYSWNYDNRQENDVKTCDFVLMDEMTGGVTASFLKLFSQMSKTAKITIRYGGMFTFDRNVPLIVISNPPPSEVYKNLAFEEVESIKDRFLCVPLTFTYHMKVKEAEEENQADRPSFLTMATGGFAKNKKKR